MSARQEARPGYLITFEGIEGSGKSTQVQRLASRLRQERHEVMDTREPGGTPAAERIRQLFLPTEQSEPLDRFSELFLILAARQQHVRHVLQPAVDAGAIVLCDRFSDSTLAYQGYGRGLDLSLLRRLNGLVTPHLTPDLTLWLDLPVAVGLARRYNTRERNRLDAEDTSFHDRVRQGFLALHEREPRRIRRIDAQRDADAIAEEIWQVVRHVLAGRHA